MLHKLIPGFSARWLLKTTGKYGIKRERLLAETGLDSDWGTKPDDWLTYAQYIQLIKNALNETNDPALGIRIGEYYNLADYGVWGYAIISSSNLGEALAISEKFWELNGALVNMVTRVENDDAVVEIFPAFTCPNEKIFIFAIEEYLTTVIASAEFLSQRPIAMKEVHLSYDPPVYNSLYTDLFKISPCFNAASNWYRFSREILELPTVMGHPTMQQICVNHCEEIVRSMHESDQLIDQIRRCLISSLGNYPSITDVSRQLKTSPRTLSRNLKDRKTSFQRILNDVRAEVAKNYLINTDLTVNQISALVGYSEPNTFSKAFKKWLGSTPSVYRQTRT